MQVCMFIYIYIYIYIYKKTDRSNRIIIESARVRGSNQD